MNVDAPMINFSTTFATLAFGAEAFGAAATLALAEDDAEGTTNNNIRKQTKTQIATYNINPADRTS